MIKGPHRCSHARLSSVMTPRMAESDCIFPVAGIRCPVTLGLSRASVIAIVSYVRQQSLGCINPHWAREIRWWQQGPPVGTIPPVNPNELEDVHTLQHQISMVLRPHISRCDPAGHLLIYRLVRGIVRGRTRRTTLPKTDKVWIQKVWYFATALLWVWSVGVVEDIKDYGW